MASSRRGDWLAHFAAARGAPNVKDKLKAGVELNRPKI